MDTKEGLGSEEGCGSCWAGCGREAAGGGKD